MICSHLQVKGKSVFITGCDSGFGHALAKHLHKLGFTVFAGCLLKVQKMWVDAKTPKCSPSEITMSFSWNPDKAKA